MPMSGTGFFVSERAESGALPGEIFAETGMKIKAEMKGKLLFHRLPGQWKPGYVPPLHELERGGYETWRCYGSVTWLGRAEKIIA